MIPKPLAIEAMRLIYQRAPELYARDILGVTWHAQQTLIARALIRHRRVMIRAGNGPGKSFVAAGLINWFYDMFTPSITLTTAPTHQQVQQVLWAYVRTLRKGRPGLMPKDSRMEDAPDHFAVGMTAIDANAFQGRHSKNMFVIFDEATGVDPQFWDAAEGMLSGSNAYWLCLLNPTDTDSVAYRREQLGGFHVISLSSLAHPNIQAELAGEKPLYHGGVSLDWLYARLNDPEWCERISKTDAVETDFEFPIHSDQWYRPGPLFESRVLGRWPTLGTSGVWNEELWNLAMVEQQPTGPYEIGCDVARKGDDFTEIVVRRGACALSHEAHNGWLTTQTAGRLKEIAINLMHGNRMNAQDNVIIKIDDDGVGGGVTDMLEGWNAIGVNAGSAPTEKERYPNKRSELWFNTARMAREGNLDLSRLSAESKSKLRLQLMSPSWKLDSQGRRVVEPKDMTKKRLGRSPDSADALNLAYAHETQDWRETLKTMTGAGRFNNALREW